MELLLTGGKVFVDGCFQNMDIMISNGAIAEMAPSIIVSSDFCGRIIECGRFFIAPAFADVHVHLREPGFSYKATVKSETRAAAAGGYTTVCAMPNVNPSPDSVEHLNEQLKLIEEGACIRVLPYGAITKGSNGEEMADMAGMAPFVCGYSDDGKGVQEDEMCLRAMEEAKRLNKPISAHCEVNALLKGGSIHEGRYAAEHGMVGISSESEWKMIERDLKLVEQTGCRYNVCHISTKESVELLRQAKAKGLPVSCETAPHYLCLCDEDLQEEGRFKMNPPLRGREDKEALSEGFCDGTIDYLATDHAPHSAEEKSRGLEKSLFGVVGLETAFAAVNTALVKTGKMSLEALIDRISVAPRRFLGLPTELKVGEKAELVVFDPDTAFTIDSSKFLSAAKATPLDGMECFGSIEYTIYDGRIVWDRNTQEN